MAEIVSHHAMIVGERACRDTTGSSRLDSSKRVLKLLQGDVAPLQQLQDVSLQLCSVMG